MRVACTQHCPHAPFPSGSLACVRLQIAKVLQHYEGMVLELHLSHNDITNEGAKRLLVKVAPPPVLVVLLAEAGLSGVGVTGFSCEHGAQAVPRPNTLVRTGIAANSLLLADLRWAPAHGEEHCSDCVVWLVCVCVCSLGWWHGGRT